MAFDPDQYLAAPKAASFDPDAYLGAKSATGFNPDQYLAAQNAADDARNGTIKAYEPSLLDIARNGLLPVSDILEKLSKVPEGMPQIPRVEDPTHPAQAALFNTLTGVLNSTPTPVGVSLLGGGLPAKIVGGLMSPIMGVKTLDQLQPTLQTIADPNATTQQKFEAGLGEASTATGALAPFMGLRKGPISESPPIDFESMKNVTPPKPPALLEGTAEGRTSQAFKEVTERLQQIPTAEGKLALLNQEIKLRGDTLSDADLRHAFDAKVQLENVIDQQNEQIAAQKAQQEAIDQQQKAQDDAQKQVVDAQKHTADMEKIQAQAQLQQLKNAGQPPPAPPEPPVEPLQASKPMVLANSASQAASAIQDNPESAQGTLNQITGVQPVAPLPEPSTLQPNALQVQGANAQVLRQPESQPENPLALQGVGEQNAQPQAPAGAREEEALSPEQGGPEHEISSESLGVNERDFIQPMSSADVIKDRKRYEELQSQMKPEDFGKPSFQKAWAESEAIKNKYGGMPPAPESIVSAAVRTTDGQIIQAPVHAMAFSTAEGLGKMVGGDASDEGFVTSTGRYVTRDEAMKIAKASEQAKNPQLPSLTAENIKDMSAAKAFSTGYQISKAISDSPEISKGIHFVDASGQLSPEFLKELASHPTIKHISSDIGAIQNAILKRLERKYPLDEFGVARFKGLMIGRPSYAVHITPGDGSKYTHILHDPFQTWKAAEDDAQDFLGNAVYNEGTISAEEEASVTPRLVYEFWRAKTAGIALHEALHQVVHEEGEGLAKELTFKAGDLVQAMMDLPKTNLTNEQYEEIYNDIQRLNSSIQFHQTAASLKGGGNDILSQGQSGQPAQVNNGPGQAGATQGGAQGEVPAIAAQEAQANQAEPLPSGQPVGGGVRSDSGPGAGQSGGGGFGAGGFSGQQRGATSTSAISSIASGGLGSAYGWLTAKKRDDETEEQFQARRLMRALVFGLGSGMSVYAFPRLFQGSPLSAKNAAMLETIRKEAQGLDKMPEWYQTLRQTAPAVALRENFIYNRARVKDAVGNVVKGGMDIANSENPFLAGKLYPGASAEAKRVADVQMRDIQNQIVAAGKASPLGVDNFLTRFNAWLEARHTPFYNQRLADLHALSGQTGPAPVGHMTDQEAFQVLRDANNDGLEPVFENLGDLYRGVVKQTRDVLEKGGLITPELRQLWEQQSPEYMPFNRLDPSIPFDDAMMVHALGGGRGVNVQSSGVRRIVGSQEELSDIGGNLLANLHDAIDRVAKNNVGIATLNFFNKLNAAGQPFPGVEVQKPKAIGLTFSDKPIREDFDPNYMMSVMQGGKPTWIRFDDPKMATAFSSMNTEPLSWMLRLMSMPTHMLSRILTGANLDFLVPNDLRHHQAAAMKAASQGDFRGAFGQMNPKNTIGDAKDVADWVLGRQTPGAQLFQQMATEGGMTSTYFSGNRDNAQKLVEQMRNANQLNKPFSWTAQRVGDFLHALNNISEGAVGLRAYKRALELGLTSKEAALYAKQKAIDFHQKGRYTSQLGSVYAFINPAIQAAVNTGKFVIRDPKVLAGTVAGLMALNAGISTWNESILPNWKRNPVLEYARTNGFPVLYGIDPQTKEPKYFTIPAAYEARGIKAVSDFLQELGNGEIRPGDNLQREAARMGGGIMHSFDILGTDPTENPKKAILPTVTRPLMEIAENKSYSGAPIVPPHLQEDQFMPEYAKRKITSQNTRTGRIANSTSDLLHKLGWDVSPERMKYLINAYSGGAGRLASSLTNLSDVQGGGLKASNVPVMDSFFKRLGPEDGSNRDTALYQNTVEMLKEAKGRDELAHQQVQTFFRNGLDKIPPAKWMDFLRNANQKGLLPQDQYFRKQLMSQMTAKLKDRDDVDRLVAQFGTDNGERAAYYAERVKDFKTQQDYLKYLDDQQKKGLINQRIVQQLIPLLKQAK